MSDSIGFTMRVMRTFAWLGETVHGVGANALSSFFLFELTDDGCSWMLALGLFSLAAAANQVVIELFRRGQASKVGGFNSSTHRRVPTFSVGEWRGYPRSRH
jgi:hypothetical protein